MTPMAGAIADADQDGFLLGKGTLKSLWLPCIPVYWIVGMLEEVGRRLVLEMIHRRVLNRKI